MPLTLRRMLFLPLVSAFLASPALGDPPASAPSTMPAALPLAAMKPEPVRQMSRHEFDALFAPFHHVPFNNAGFNALALPFHFASPDHTGDPAEANAFSFLLSDNLDWSPGSYNTRHAYFVFDRDKAGMLDLQKSYDPTFIRDAIKHWNATNAVGGILKHSAKGYSGTLKIFDAGGITLRSIDYAEPRPFADLLGDMTVDALTILDQKPSPALAAFLHTPVCAHPESISALGKAAFLPQFSPELFAAYDRILKDDPTFAAVRHWYANQKYWKDGDAAARDLQTAIAISDRPNPAYFIDLLINNVADKKLAAHFPEWLDRAQKVIGVDSPDLLAGRWMNKAAPDANDGPAFQHALEVAGRYPNNSSLLYALARVSSTPNSRFLDFDLAVALHGCMLYNRYMPGTDDRAQECAAISAELEALGRWQDAASFAALGLQIDPSADRAIQAMIDADSSLGRFHDALALAEKSAGHLTPEAIERAAVDYALSGDPQGLEHFFSKNALALKQRHADLIVDTYLALLRNQPMNPSGTAAMLFMARAPSDELFPLLVQIDLLHGTAHFQGMIAESLGMFPGNRQLWFLFDKCTQRPPGFNAADVYFSLAHLHPEDDWCVQAQKRSAHLGGALTSPAAVQQILADFPADHPQTPDAARQKRNHTLFYTGLAPFTAASAFFQLLDAGQTARAQDVASRYHTFALEVGQPAGIIFAQHLVRIAAPEPATAPRSDE